MKKQVYILILFIALHSISINAQVPEPIKKPPIEELPAGEQLINLNPDPNGDPWWAGGLLKLTPEAQSYINSMPGLELSPESAAIDLPDMVDNSQNMYMRDIFLQDSNSCTHAASIGYVFTYEMNYARGLSSDVEANQYPTHFSYNFWNKGSGTVGTYIWTGSYIAVSMGIPNLCVWDDECNMGGDPRKWMSGYEKYRNALSNRLEWAKKICFWYSCTTNPEEELETLKHWLNDHNEGADVGGIAYFGTNIGGAEFDVLPAASADPGKQIMTVTGTTGGHVMTIVGYNDNIKYDYNNSGDYTNDLDWAGLYDNEGNPMPDGIIDLRDWEIGAFKVANSWGSDWLDDGGYVYMGYRQLIEHLPDANSTDAVHGHNVYFQKAIGNHEPGVELNVKLEYSSRDKLEMALGDESDYRSFPGWKGFYGSLPMQGVNLQPIEITVDCNYFLREDFKRIRFITRDFSSDHTGVIWKYAITDTRWNEEFTLTYDQLNIPITDGYNSYFIDYDLLPFEIEENLILSGNMVSRFTPTVSNNSVLTIEDDVQIDFYNSTIIINSGSSMIIGNNVTFNGVAGDAVIYNSGVISLNGSLNVPSNKTLTITGPGYVYLNGNINAGPGASISFEGTNRNEKLLEVQKKIYFDTDFASVSIKDGKIVMNNTYSELYINSGVDNVSLDNIYVTSSSGTKNYHDGIDIRSGGIISVNNSAFKYGAFGLYAYNAGGYPKT